MYREDIYEIWFKSDQPSRQGKKGGDNHNLIMHEIVPYPALYLPQHVLTPLLHVLIENPTHSQILKKVLLY